MLLDIGLVVLGVTLLAGGGEALIRGAMSAAQRFGVSPLLTGLLIVGFGTSMPELVVSVGAAYTGNADIAIGNVVGSNIGNVLLILGACALITPLKVEPVALRRDSLVVVGAAVLFIGLGLGGGLERWNGAILLAALIGYVAWTYRSDKKKHDSVAQMHEHEAEALHAIPKSGWLMAGAVALGLALLIGGARLMVEGATGLAQSLGASEATIGMTVVAVGTSFPELTVSIMAAIRRQGDVAIGNILGSNIFNVLGILGVASLVQPLAVQGRAATFDQWVMLGTSVLLLLFLVTHRRISRWEGAVFLVGYVAYVVVGLQLAA